ncbi:serine/threonine protein kinase [Leptolyngbya sp. FACHB-36]|nr:serine/threonine protein kinase [Leptolyngbya sp. FACHB-36]
MGTVLRQRYQIQQILGQGGFGRTYLALDQERFQERCVLKEFTVPYQDSALVEKSKLLFRREASALYQIQHPQVPRFWAAFEDEARLFLVQSYVEGQTYRHLLHDHKQVFTESEVLHLLTYLLPVLGYLHDRNIVHRDISPENIILQPHSSMTYPIPEQGLPVLIDFGAVKEATSHSSLLSAPMTRVGKVGYAPPEQLQTGKVYPNSDLYALAATCLALLTGREPRTLLDARTLTWQWQPYATMSDGLADILGRMLSLYPGDRYRSAQEVLADLQAISVLPTTLSKPITSDSPPTAQVAESPISTSTEPVRSSFYQALGLGSMVRVGLITAALVGVGVALPLLWRARTQIPEAAGEVWVSGAKLPQSEASRLMQSQASNSVNSLLTAPTTPKATKPSVRLQFASGTSTIVQGSVREGEVQPYLLQASEGQLMTATLEGGVVMTVLRSNEAIETAAYRTRKWTGQLPADDQYQIQVTGSGRYALEVTLARSIVPQTQRVIFASGTSGTSVMGRLSPNQLRRYELDAKRGQRLVVRTLRGAVTFNTIAPNGQQLGGSTLNSKNWQGRLPQDGKYTLEVSTAQAGEYSLSIEVF